jgi:hypothetical protein
MNTIAFLWIDSCPNARLERAQVLLKESVLALGLKPVCFECGPAMVKFADVLRFAREHAKGDSFVWCNSDVILTRDPYETSDLTKVHGFHRREIPGGEICGGEDMYLIPNGIWDDLLSKDIPDLWCGATHIDWWLTNAACLGRCYESHTGFIDHISHETSGASKRKTNKFYRHNIRQYNKWASRQGATVFLERIELPIVGESLSPLTDLWRRSAKRAAC